MGNKRIIYLCQDDTLGVGENYAKYYPEKCLNSKFVVSLGLDFYISEQKVFVRYIHEDLIKEEDYLLDIFIGNMVNELIDSFFSTVLLIVPNGVFMDRFYQRIADYLDVQEMVTLHCPDEPPKKSLNATTLRIPVSVDALSRKGIFY